MRHGLEDFRNLIVQHPMELVLPLIIFAITFLIAWVARQIVMRVVRAWTSRSHSRSGEILHEAFSGPSLIWCVMLGLHFAMQSSDLPPRVTALGAQILLILWILSLTIMLTRVAGDLVRLYGGQISGALPVTTLTQNLAQVAVVIMGILILLRQFGVSITPMLTALGVGGLAVALALQDTLSNLFGGFYMAVAGQVRLGDYIKLNSGEEGYVTDIGWRSTTIRALANNLIIVPNSKLAQAIVTNFHLPEKRMGTSINVVVGYDCDIAHIERVLQDLLATASREIPGMLSDPAPSVTFDPGFTDNGVGFSLNYQVAEFVQQYGVRNELRRRIFFKFRDEGVTVPYPSRVVFLREGAAAGVNGGGNAKKMQPGAPAAHH